MSNHVVEDWLGGCLSSNVGTSYLYSIFPEGCRGGLGTRFLAFRTEELQKCWPPPCLGRICICIR
jgi:hypothetical protein